MLYLFIFIFQEDNVNVRRNKTQKHSVPRFFFLLEREA